MKKKELGEEPAELGHLRTAVLQQTRGRRQRWYPGALGASHGQDFWRRSHCARKKPNDTEVPSRLSLWLSPVVLWTLFLGPLHLVRIPIHSSLVRQAPSFVRSSGNLPSFICCPNSNKGPSLGLNWYCKLSESTFPYIGGSCPYSQVMLAVNMMFLELFFK